MCQLIDTQETRASDDSVNTGVNRSAFWGLVGIISVVCFITAYAIYG